MNSSVFQLSKQRPKVKEMKKEGQTPKRKKLPIIDPDVFDDCGEKVSDLAKLDENCEELCWWEMPGDSVENYFLDESEYDIRDFSHWLNSPTVHPQAWRF